jgi:predicted ester cyclase
MMLRFSRLFFGAAACIGAAAGPAFALETHCTGREKYLERYLQIHHQLYVPRDESRVAEFYAENFTSPDSDRGGADATGGPQLMARVFAESKKSFPKRELKEDMIFCVDNFVIVRTILSGTMDGEMMGQAPTGKSYSITAIDIYEFNDEMKIVRRWGNSDLAGMLRQLGLSLTPPKKSETAPSSGR